MARTADPECEREILDRLGDPNDLVAEASVDLPQPAQSRSSASEVIAVLLLALGAFALSLIGPFVGVLIMMTTPRWIRSQVRTTSLIIGIGVLALIALVALAASGATGSAILIALALLAAMVGVGPIAALHAVTRPRPVE